MGKQHFRPWDFHIVVAIAATFFVPHSISHPRTFSTVPQNGPTHHHLDIVSSSVKTELAPAVSLTSSHPPPTMATNAVAAQSLAPNDLTVNLSIIGAGATASNPTLGTYVTLNITASCGPSDAGIVPPSCPLPQWVRIDRADGVADTSPFVRIADEAASFANAPDFPVWVKPAWGPIQLGFGGSVDNKPIPIVASGWSAPQDQGGVRTKMAHGPCLSTTAH